MASRQNQLITHFTDDFHCWLTFYLDSLVLSLLPYPPSGDLTTRLEDLFPRHYSSPQTRIRRQQHTADAFVRTATGTRVPPALTSLQLAAAAHAAYWLAHSLNVLARIHAAARWPLQTSSYSLRRHLLRAARDLHCRATEHRAFPTCHPPPAVPPWLSFDAVNAGTTDITATCRTCAEFRGWLPTHAIS